MPQLLWYIYRVLVGTLPNNTESFFNIGGDIIETPKHADHFDFIMEHGRYRLTITKIE